MFAIDDSTVSIVRARFNEGGRDAAASWLCSQWLGLSHAAALDVVNKAMSKANILLIEDDRPQAELLELFLSECGYRVVIAQNIKGAMASISEAPDLIIADYHLHDDINGFDGVEYIRKYIGQSIPAIILTGNTCANIVRKARESECYIIHKPCKVPVLLSTVAKVIENHQQ